MEKPREWQSDVLKLSAEIKVVTFTVQSKWLLQRLATAHHSRKPQWFTQLNVTCMSQIENTQEKSTSNKRQQNTTPNVCFEWYEIGSSHSDGWLSPHSTANILLFLAREVFVRTNHRAIAIMFIRPSVCLAWAWIRFFRGFHCRVRTWRKSRTQSLTHPAYLMPRELKLLLQNGW